MSNGVISFPFRLTPTGEVATVARGSDAEVNEAIAVLLLTQQGERPMVPGFGLPDPAFAGLATGDVQLGVNDFGPAGVRVEAVDVEQISETAASALVSWSRESGGPR